MPSDLIQRAVERLGTGPGPSLVERAATRLNADKRVEGLGPRDPKAPSVADVELRGPRMVPGAAAPGAAPGSGAAWKPEAASFEASTSVEIDFDRLEERGMVTPSSNRSLIAEEYRMIKRPLLNVALAEGEAAVRNGNLIMVTSARPGEGKTFTAINLALSIASERDIQVLLVDADSKQTTMLSQLGLAAETGLVDMLAGDQPLSQVMLKTNLPNLMILPAGRAHPNATELLASREMEDLVEALASQSRRRIIIFDAPPVLASSEATVLAQHVGQVLVVVEAEKTNRRALEGTLALIKGCPNINMLLNKSKFSLGSEYFGAYYGD
ncbi:MAG: XrtA-associated tyrosine autokinase [Pseudomonadota bacterium]